MVKHEYKLDTSKIRDIEDVKVILQSLGIKYTKEAINKDLKKLTKKI